MPTAGQYSTLPRAFTPPEAPRRYLGPLGGGPRGGGGGGAPGAFRGRSAGLSYEAKGLRKEVPGRKNRADILQGRGDELLMDPLGTTNLFRGVFEDQARGFAAPALRDFNDSIRGVAGSAASRFGGNASSEEQRQVQVNSDLFSRNLTESLARLAPQAAGMGLDYAGQVGQAGGQARSEEDRIRQMILQAISGYQEKEKGGGFWGTVGGLAGTAAAALI